MSHKHYRAIAEAIRENIDIKSQLEGVAKALLKALKDSNPRFDATKFIHAVISD